VVRIDVVGALECVVSTRHSTTHVKRSIFLPGR
jgi:hypothetical protein